MNIYLIHILIKLKNASIVKKEVITLSCSYQGLRLIKLLYINNIIQAFSYNTLNNALTVIFKSYLNKVLFSQLHFMSTPSQDVFITFRKLCRLQLQPKTSFFISTDSGLVTEQNCKRKKAGGKVLFLY